MSDQAPVTDQASVTFEEREVAGGRRIGFARLNRPKQLNALTLEGTAGESVVIEIRREGQPLQLVMPRGPLGIFGGFRGRPR